jgi:hypothetical protein
MALSMTINTVYGVDVTDAYHRVEGLSLPTKDTIRFHCRAYKATNKPFIAEVVYTIGYTLDGDNPIRQAYLHLKTLPEFANAVDC